MLRSYLQVIFKNPLAQKGVMSNTLHASEGKKKAERQTYFGSLVCYRAH